MSGTPTPWKLGSHRGFGSEHDIEGPDGQDMSGIRAMFYHREDAERTVRAVNALAEAHEDETLAVMHRGGYAPLFALLIVREEDDGTLTGYFGKEGTHVDGWDSDLGWPEPAENEHDLVSVLRTLADRLEEMGSGRTDRRES